MSVTESYWHTFIRTNLFTRITDDKAYMAKRLGRVPSDEEIYEAIAHILDTAVDQMAIALDDPEADVWRILEGDE